MGPRPLPTVKPSDSSYPESLYIRRFEHPEGALKKPEEELRIVYGSLLIFLSILIDPFSVSHILDLLLSCWKHSGKFPNHTRMRYSIERRTKKQNCTDVEYKGKPTKDDGFPEVGRTTRELPPLPSTTVKCLKNSPPDASDIPLIYRSDV